LWRDDPRVIAALEAYLERLRAGRPLSRDEFLSQHAEIAEALRQCLSGMEFIEAAAVQLDATGPHPSGEPAESIPPSARLGDYRILHEVGRGGMGVVYEAEQLSLGRRVALKVLPFAAAIDPRQRQRFQIEAQAAAQLHHPHIVPVFGVGCDHGIHYYAMQFVEGRSLAAILQELRATHELAAGPGGSARAVPGPSQEPHDAHADPAFSAGEESRGAPLLGPQGVLAGPNPETTASPIPGLSSSSQALAPTVSGSSHRDRGFCRNVARLGADAADALEHAHGLGILHRDIKPANLLIDSQGAVWITDFGLARFPSDLSLTQTGDLVGTLRYMSPEQALARRGVVDQRTDIYSLGVTLYELLTLRPAFDGRDHHELLRQIALDEPVRPRRLNPAVPRDLETVILKATAKDPSSRYATASELAGDLRRFLDDQPILARRPGPLERTLRWARRRKELVATAATILALALLIGGIVTYNQIRAREAMSRGHRDYIVETYPLLDRLAMHEMSQATKLLSGPSVAETREIATQLCQEARALYEHASQLPPSDAESRRIIARAYKQLGFARGILSGAAWAKESPDATLVGQADADYRRAITLYAELLSEAPADRQVRRHFAEALGTSGRGWLLSITHRAGEAEPLYRRAVQLGRELVHEIGAVGPWAILQDNTAELSDLSYLTANVQMLAGIVEGRGQVREAELLRHQLVEDVSGVAARLAAPVHKPRLRMWASQLHDSGKAAVMEPNHRLPALTFELAMILDPENADVCNFLAWILVRFPCQTPYDPTRGLALAQKAVQLEPDNWMYWNTLGVAAFRTCDWTTAARAFLKSINLTGGDSTDWFFLAMTRWHQGNKTDARGCFDRGVALVKQDTPPKYRVGEVYYFHAEAAALMGLPGPKPEPYTSEEGEKKSTSRTVQQGAGRPDNDTKS
jgi:serine/threonine protein kinase